MAVFSKFNMSQRFCHSQAVVFDFFSLLSLPQLFPSVFCNESLIARLVRFPVDSFFWPRRGSPSGVSTGILLARPFLLQ